MKTNERKQENKIIKFEHTQHEILKRICLYISQVDKHFELKYNDVYSDVIDTVISILGTVCFDAFSKLDEPISFVYEGTEYNNFDLLVCCIIPNGDVFKTVVYIDSHTTSCVITAYEDITSYGGTINFDCRAWSEDYLPLTVGAIVNHDYEAITLFVCDDLSNEVRDKVGNIWLSALAQMADEAVAASVYRADMLYKDVVLVFNSFIKDKQWITLFLTKDGLSCFNFFADESGNIILQHDYLSHEDSVDSVVNIPTIVVGCYPEDVFVSDSKAGK